MDEKDAQNFMDGFHAREVLGSKVVVQWALTERHVMYDRLLEILEAAPDF